VTHNDLSWTSAKAHYEHAGLGTCCRLISRSETLVKNSSDQALGPGSLCKPTHGRALWELHLSGTLHMPDLIVMPLVYS